MTDINQILQAALDTLTSDSKERKLYFFKGFAMPQLELIARHPCRILGAEGVIRDGTLDLAALNEKWLDLITAIQTAQGPLVGFYEELLVIQDVLPRIQTGEIVVVENNMLSPWTPSCLPYGQALALFDFQHEDRDPQEPLLQMLSQFYGDVKLLEGEKALVLPVALDADQLVYRPFWEGPYQVGEPDEGTLIEIGSPRDWEYRLDLLYGKREPAVFLQCGEELSARQQGLARALAALGMEFVLDELELYQEKITYHDGQFLPLLHKYWGAEASFRPLLFYQDPDRSKETHTLSQGQLVAEIIAQCEGAMSGEDYSNIFITAPTGAGKSLLFQLPALYLAEKYQQVTIVVSPLIALMNDQVQQLQQERGISIAACLNSTMTMEERTNTIAQIQAGKKSLLYLAPELLLTTHLQTFLGGRSVGLVVIDEAHTVTSWGRDFRSDYWFLGDFLKKAKRDGLTFPVLCLTATAVYSGEDDVVNDTIHELGLGKTIIHLGHVKRHNIQFDIVRHDMEKLTTRVETVKMDLLLDRMRRYTDAREKVLTYFPYRRQVDEVYNLIPVREHGKFRRYHAKVPPAERKMVERSYKSGEAKGLFCTKAFGMGIDVGDIVHVIHFAPTGTLADYVQEIGRAARDPALMGTAHIDYFPSDLKYVRALNSISEMRQYQLQEMLKKLCALYNSKKRRNLLVSAETFAYLFREDEVENRTKSGLMLLAKDLDNKFSFPVLIVRPKAMLSKHYVSVPAEIEPAWLRKYGAYAEPQAGSANRTVLSSNQSRASDMTVYAGTTYRVDMAGIWENCYPDRAFGMFKQEFFSEEFKAGRTTYHAAPQVRVELRFTDDYDAVCQRLAQILEGMTALFSTYKNAAEKQFTQVQFEHDLAERLGEKLLTHEKMALLLDVFTEDVDEQAAFTQSRSQIRILRKRKQAGSEESVYFVSNPSYARLSNVFHRYLYQCSPNTKDNIFYRFYPLSQNKPIEIMPLLRVLELLDLASYEIRGGEKAEIFLRINDPIKLMRLANGRYSNGVLQAIQSRHERNRQMLSAFFTTDLSTEARWDLIEAYFLGDEAYVSQVLRLS